MSSLALDVSHVLLSVSSLALDVSHGFKTPPRAQASEGAAVDHLAAVSQESRFVPRLGEDVSVHISRIHVRDTDALAFHLLTQVMVCHVYMLSRGAVCGIVGSTLAVAEQVDGRDVNTELISQIGLESAFPCACSSGYIFGVVGRGGDEPIDLRDPVGSTTPG